MQNYQEITLKTALWLKIVNFVYRNSPAQLARKAGELFLGGFLGALALKPSQIIDFVSVGLKAQNYATVKMAVMLVLFFNRKYIFRFLAKKYQSFSANLQVEGKEKLVFGIPISELADYLMRNRHFKREGINGVRSTFGLNMEKFNLLASGLESAGVLCRGDNNARFLKPEWTRQTLVDFLGQNEKSKNIKPIIKITRIGQNEKIRLSTQEIAA